MRRRAEMAFPRRIATGKFRLSAPKTCGLRRVPVEHGSAGARYRERADDRSHRCGSCVVPRRCITRCDGMLVAAVSATTSSSFMALKSAAPETQPVDPTIEPCGGETQWLHSVRMLAIADAQLAELREQHDSGSARSWHLRNARRISRLKSTNGKAACDAVDDRRTLRLQ